MELSNPYTEVQVLGAMLRDSDTAANIVEDGILRPSDFMTPEHRLVADAIFEMRRWDREISVPSVSGWLVSRDQFDLIGGPDLLSELRESAGNLASATTELLALSSRRDLRELGAILSLEAANEGKAIEQVIDEAEEKLMLLRRHGHQEVRPIGDYTDAFLTRIEAQRSGSTAYGFFTKWKPLDGVIQGMEKNDFSVIGGRPGDGKSTLIKFLSYLNVLKPHAEERRAVYIADFEEGEAMVVMRFVAILTGISSTFLKQPRLLTDDQLESVKRAIEHLKHCPLFFDSKSGVSPQTYKSRVKKAMREARTRFNTELAWHTADYLQRMIGQGETEVARAKDVSNKMRDSAKSDQLDIPALATVQLNRTPVDSQGRRREYTESDIKESGAVEQDASVIIFPKRLWILNSPNMADVLQFPENRGPNGEPTPGWQVEPMQWHIAKNRNGQAPAYTEMLIWHRYCGRYETLQEYQQRTGVSISL